MVKRAALCILCLYTLALAQGLGATELVCSAARFTNQHHHDGQALVPANGSCPGSIHCNWLPAQKFDVSGDKGWTITEAKYVFEEHQNTDAGVRQRTIEIDRFTGAAIAIFIRDSFTMERGRRVRQRQHDTVTGTCGRASEMKPKL